MNELLFFLHTFVVIGCLIGATRLGKQALITCFFLFVLLCNLFVTKEITLFNLHVTATDPLAIGAFFSLNTLSNHYGKEVAKKCINYSFLFLLVFLALTKIHLLYLPTAHDSTQDAFKVILSPAFRLITSSLVVFYLSGRLDIALFSYFKSRKVPMCFALSLLISSLFDTTLFTVLGLYGIVESVFSIIIISYLIKVIAIFCMTPFTHCLRKYAPLPL